MQITRGNACSHLCFQQLKGELPNTFHGTVSQTYKRLDGSSSYNQLVGRTDPQVELNRTVDRASKNQNTALGKVSMHIANS